MSIADKLAQISKNEQRVYNAGYEKGKSEGGNTEEAYEQGVTDGKKSEYDAFGMPFRRMVTKRTITLVLQVELGRTILDLNIQFAR